MAGEGNISNLVSLLKVITDAGVKAGDVAFRFGLHTTIDEDDTVASGLSEVLGVVAVLESDPVILCDRITVVMGSSGNFQIKSWRPTDTTLTTPIVATEFSKAVRWMAIGRP